MSHHRVDDLHPSRALIKRMIGVRHRLSGFYNPAVEDSGLLRMYPGKGTRSDGHRSEIYRNLGTSAASQVLSDLFAEFDSYVLGLADQRIVEHRPVCPDDRLHSDVFLEDHERAGGIDSFEVRVIFTDTIGAMVFSCFLTFTGTLDAVTADGTDSSGTSTDSANSADQAPGIAVSS